MKECRHGIEADACELCQEHIRAVAARAPSGPGRPLSLSPERRSEIARIAAQQKWRNVIWDGVKIGELRVRHKKAPTPRRASNRWSGVETKRSRIIAILKADPNRRPSDIAQEVGTDPSTVSTIRGNMGLPRLKRPKKEPVVLTRADLDADPNKLHLVRKIYAHVQRRYHVKRIAQLLGLPLDEVKMYVTAIKDPTFTIPKAADRSKPMSDEDLHRAYALWKEGHTYRSISQMLGLTFTQTQKNLTKLLQSLGEK